MQRFSDQILDKYRVRNFHECFFCSTKDFFIENSCMIRLYRSYYGGVSVRVAKLIMPSFLIFGGLAHAEIVTF